MNSSLPFKATAAENPLCFHHSLRVQHSAFASRTHGFHERTNWANTAAQPHYDDYHCEKRHSKFFSNGFSDEWYARLLDEVRLTKGRGLARKIAWKSPEVLALRASEPRALPRDGTPPPTTCGSLSHPLSILFRGPSSRSNASAIAATTDHRAERKRREDSGKGGRTCARTRTRI